MLVAMPVTMAVKMPAPPVPLHVRDGTGHLRPQYAVDLEALGQASAEPTDLVAFLDADIRRDALAEHLGEDFVRTATSGEDEAAERPDDESIEEMGGHIVESPTATELAEDADAAVAKRTLFPTTGHAP